MDIAIANVGEELTLRVRVVKAEVSDHSYYGEHARYRVEALEAIVDDEGNVVIAEGLDWIEVRQPSDATTLLMNAERKAKHYAAEAEADDDDASLTEADVEDLTVAQLRALGEEHGVELPSKARKAELQELLLNA